QLKAHKYFQYRVDEQGQLQYQKNDELIRSEQNLDGLYLLHTDLAAAQCAKEQVLGNYKNLLAVEDAFCQLKSYMEVRPVFHWRPDRVRNHVRLFFIAYWLCAKLAHEWLKLPRFDGHGNSNKKRESRWKRKGSTLSIKRSFGARPWKW